MNNGPEHVKYYRLQDTSNTNFLWNTILCFSLLHRACCFDYFFNIPTRAPIIYTLKNTKLTLKHLKTLKICPYMFRSIF